MDDGSDTCNQTPCVHTQSSWIMYSRQIGDMCFVFSWEKLLIATACYVSMADWTLLGHNTAWCLVESSVL